MYSGHGSCNLSFGLPHHPMNLEEGWSFRKDKVTLLIIKISRSFPWCTYNKYANFCCTSDATINQSFLHIKIFLHKRGVGKFQHCSWMSPQDGSKRSDLNHVDFWYVVILRGDVQRISIIVGDDEYDGGRAEGHPLFGPVRSALWHHDGAYGMFHAGQGAVLNAFLQAGQPRTQQLQHASTKLTDQKSDQKWHLNGKCKLLKLLC